MCTALSYKTNAHYFGRNFDLERSYGEEVTVTPRRFPLKFIHMGDMNTHYAMIGMAAVVDGTPLYFDAVNEQGLSAAGLNFPNFAVYGSFKDGHDNVASFEVIPWLLASCKSVSEVRTLLQKINITADAFSESLPTTPLHWMISDRRESIVLESVGSGVKIHNDPAGVLSNSPDFESHIENLNALKECFNDRLASGLPGDFSSEARFVRAALVRERSACGDGDEESIDQFFRILSSVSVPRGCVLTDDGEYHYTRYSSCCNTDRGIYYYTTHENSCVTAVDMQSCDTDGHELTIFPRTRGQM